MSRYSSVDKITLNVTEAAELLGISRSTLYSNLLYREDFPAFRLGGRILIPKERLIEWANTRDKNLA